MNKSQIDISVIVTAHNEGQLVHHTMRSILRSIEVAEKAGIRCQIIAVLDNPSERTADYFERYVGGPVQVEKINCFDPGLARNHGIKLASGKYVALLDGDDLFGSLWLKKAFGMAEKSENDCVFYPEYVITFEGNQRISKYKGSSDAGFDYATMLEFNCWNSVHYFTKKSLLLNNLYHETPLNSGFGYEDWHWYCEVLAKGIEIKIVPETCVFYRKKKQRSRLDVHVNYNVISHPSKLFDYKIFENFCERQKPLFKRRNPLVARIKDNIHKRAETKVRSYPRLHTLILILVDIAKRLRRRKPEMLRIQPWLLEEWKGINAIEPQIYPDKTLLEKIEVYKIPPSRIGRHYLELCELYGKNVSHVFLIPWLKRGGSDLVTINYIKALAENDLARALSTPVQDRLPGERLFGKRIAEGLHVIAQDDRILKDPPPTIGLLELADSSVNFAVRPWVNAADYWNVYFDITEKMKKRFDAEGITIPFPQRDFHVYDHTE